MSEPYRGFEQGPIRPPSEANSLLLRVSRNCPWNRCTFCPVYKDERFSIRPAAHVKRDIDAVWRHVQLLCERISASAPVQAAIQDLAVKLEPDELPAFQAACHWLVAGRLKSIFLQDANSLAIKPAALLEILEHIRLRFPRVERITSYARSQSVARLAPETLAELREAGLSRIHVGLESGADEVLARVQKGATQELHVKAGLMAKAAGFELSEYYMPGLGGSEFTRVNAIETASAMNLIDPDFIRLRSLAVPEGIPLFDELQSGGFTRCSEVQVQEEILLFLESLDGIGSKVRSDHILNLLPEVNGMLPGDADRMTRAVRDFLVLPPDERTLFQVGRRLGIFAGLGDLEDTGRRALVSHNLRRLGVTEQNCDEILDELMRRFV